jgi:pimeloyl-ACP methyl ester carboxylesterase
LWGQSYGSRVALTLLRRRPEGIRSVILDGPYPPEVAGRHNSNAPTIALLGAVFEACKRDDDCNKAYPDLPAKWTAAIQRFRANPVRVESDPGSALGKQVFDVNDVLLISLVENMLYTSDGVAGIPQLVESLSRGDHAALEEPLADLDLVWFGPYISTGASFTIDCNDHPKSNDAEERARAEREPLYRDWILFGVTIRSCALWNPSDNGTLDTSPVVSDKPALIVSGAWDVATPAAWADLAAKSLSRGQIVRIGNAAHDASEHECAQAALYLFLENPGARLELDCAARSAAIKFKFDEAKPERRKKDKQEK